MREGSAVMHDDCLVNILFRCVADMCVLADELRIHGPILARWHKCQRTYTIMNCPLCVSSGIRYLDSPSGHYLTFICQMSSGPHEPVFDCSEQIVGNYLYNVKIVLIVIEQCYSWGHH